MRIKSVLARQIINSKGFPTLEVEVSSNKYSAISAVPLAASKSKYEYYDVYDHDLQKFDGQTLDIVLENIHRTIAPELIGQRSMDQEDLDSLILQIDNSFNRSKLGVNTITALSQAIAKLGALESDLPLFKYIRVLNDFSDINNEKLQSNYTLPTPVVTVHKSANHDRGNELPVQEVLVLPKGKFSYSVNLVEFFEKLQNLNLDSKNKTLHSFISNLDKEVSKAKLELGIDFSSSRFKRDDHNDYIINNFHSDKVAFRGDFKKLVHNYIELIKKHNLVFLEDLFDEDEYSGWNEILDQGLKINRNLQIVSDDFTASNIERLEKIALLEASNNVVIKPSQTGTITEVINFAARARKYGMNTTVSYRHGETEDTFISDLAVGINANYIRTGYFKGSEHNSKLNRLVQIEQSL